MTNATTFPWLTVIIFLPLLGAALCFAVREESARWLALGVTVADFVVSLPLWWLFDPSTAQMQFVERATWITSPPIQYSLGLDGISLPLVIMTTFLMPLCVAVSWTAIEKRVQTFMAVLLVMETAMLGVFTALDFVLFYVFWEAMLIPMYLLIGVWGGPNRLYAAIKFFLYTLAGSVLLLVAILVLYFQGGQTFDILTLSQGDLQPDAPDLALPGIVRGLRGQGPDVSVPHLVAGRPRGSPHGGQRHPGQRVAQDGHLRVPALFAPDAP